MEIKKQQETSLSMLFLRYLAIFCAVTIGMSAILVLSFYFALAKGMILPANYAEQALQKVEGQLIQSKNLDTSLIPFPCKYVLLGKFNTVQSSSLSKKEQVKVKEYLSGKKMSSGKKYIELQRKDGSKLILEYDLFAHFKNPVLHKLFPKPELLTIALVVVFFLLIALVTAFQFSKKIKVELAPLIQATNSIKQKNLNFESTPTHIRELNTVLQSIEELKTALSASLKEQWDIERGKITQISAIAHDIKTPLTIIQGNTELLLEMDQSLEEKELLQYVQSSTEKIENYIELLMGATQITGHVKMHRQSFAVEAFLADLEKQARALCHVKKITLSIEHKGLPLFFYGDTELISRAILNIMDNAVEHSPKGSEVEWEITGKEEEVLLIIRDNGEGFSVEGLKNATTEFYTEQKERAGKHYGMGLFIAKSIAERHGGGLEIANRKGGSGAVVFFKIKGVGNRSRIDRHSNHEGNYL